MNIQYKSSIAELENTDWIILGVPVDQNYSAAQGVISSELESQLELLKAQGDIKGKVGTGLTLHSPKGLNSKRLFCTGLGDSESLTRSELQKAWMISLKKAASFENQNIAVIATTLIPIELQAEIFATCVQKATVAQSIYQSETSRYRFESATLIVPESADGSAVQTSLDNGTILGDSINLARDLINRAPNEIFPISFADRASQVAQEAGLKIELFDENRLREEKMGALLAVAQGSQHEPRMVIVEHKGASEESPVYSIVGKGVTFDSGGHSLKPSEGMKAMKADMSGAATVLAVMTAISKMNLPINVRGYMGLAENMLSGTAYRLGDVLTARNGTTIEVHNTDAEGRLVLADVLSYAVDQGTEAIIDLATLTGACVVALGEEYTGVFSNNQDWCDKVVGATKDAGELAWQLPTDSSFDAQLKSDYADCKNVGTRWGGGITAAKFLEKFVSGKPWVHLDIAGPAYTTSKKSHQDSGASGVMISSLVELFKKLS